MATRPSNEAVSSAGAADAAATDELASADERRAAALALLAQDHRILATRWAAIAVAIEAGAEAGSVRECIVGLIEAAREHFVNEEWAMRTVGWPDYLAHKAEHARLLRDACDMLKNFDVAFTAADWPALATYFRHWLASHHASHDDEMFAALSDRHPGSAPAA